MILGERRGECDARLCGLGAVHVKNDIVQGHACYFTAILAGDPAASGDTSRGADGPVRAIDPARTQL